MLIILGIAYSQTASADLTVQLTPATYNGYNISCFGGQDGGFEINVSGGTPPYQIYVNDEIVSSANLTNLSAGFYHVVVYDNSNQMDWGEAEISLSQPQPLILNGSIYVYNNNFNVSCFHCFDGYISLNGQGGVEPYSYLWFDYSTNSTHNSLATGTYSAIITDANGCVVNSENFYVSSPPQDDWTLKGNSGIDPDSMFMGTTDSVDFVLKTNGTERMRIKSSGNLEVSSLAGEMGMVYVDSNGELLNGTTTALAPCNSGPRLVWQGFGEPTYSFFTCPDIKVGVGTYSLTQLFTVNGNSRLISDNSSNGLEILGGIAVPAKRGISLEGDGSGKFNFYIHDSQNNASFNFLNGRNSANLVTIKSNGQVGIGVIPDVNSSSKLQVEGTIAAREVKVTSTIPFPDFVFKNNYKLRTLGELESYIKENKHLPEISSAEEVECNGGINVGEMQVKLLQKIEELTLYMIEQDKKIRELERKFVKKEN